MEKAGCELHALLQVIFSQESNQVSPALQADSPQLVTGSLICCEMKPFCFSLGTCHMLGKCLGSRKQEYPVMSPHTGEVSQWDNGTFFSSAVCLLLVFLCAGSISYSFGRGRGIAPLSNIVWRMPWTGRLMADHEGLQVRPMRRPAFIVGEGSHDVLTGESEMRSLVGHPCMGLQVEHDWAFVAAAMPLLTSQSSYQCFCYIAVHCTTHALADFLKIGILKSLWIYYNVLSFWLLTPKDIVGS